MQADGGTRTAAISGGWVAMALALRPLIVAGELPEAALKRQITAVSVGIIGGQALLDLDYSEDATAEVDLNVVMTATSEFIEVQGTAEGEPFRRNKLESLLDCAANGIVQINRLQLSSLPS